MGELFLKELFDKFRGSCDYRRATVEEKSELPFLNIYDYKINNEIAEELEKIFPLNDYNIEKRKNGI